MVENESFEKKAEQEETKSFFSAAAIGPQQIPMGAAKGIL